MKNRIHLIKQIWQDLILLESEGQFALIDTGHFDNIQEIKNYFAAIGVKSFEFVVITHFHVDHYGNLTDILKDFPVKKVYLKRYSGLDQTTSAGKPANDEYRKSEMKKFQEVCEFCERKSKLYFISKKTKKLKLGNFMLRLYNLENLINKAYNDKNSKNYHKYYLNENYNSTPILLKCKKFRAYLASDMVSKTHPEKYLNRLNEKFTKKIGKVDVYKTAHHGQDDSTNEKVLKFLRPQFCFITNSKDYSTTFNWKHNFDETRVICTDEKSWTIEIENNSFFIK